MNIRAPLEKNLLGHQDNSHCCIRQHHPKKAALPCPCPQPAARPGPTRPDPQLRCVRRNPEPDPAHKVAQSGFQASRLL